MRKLLLSILVLSGTFAVTAQPTVITATFDTMHLSQPDTFYVNYSAPGTDVGFDDGALHFPCVYDTAFGFSFWSYGFAYSNMTDSATSGIINQYSAKTAEGHNSSSTYAVAYGARNTVSYMTGAGPFTFWDGFYITNSTYAYNSMRDGDAFAKKFGGATGNDPDWLKLTIKRYSGGTLNNDSVEFYLADFRSPNNANDYIVKDWQWVDLNDWNADSIMLTLTSSDTCQFGRNTPAYYCIDDFKVNLLGDAVSDVASESAAKIYPIPASATLNIETKDASYTHASIVDMTGRTVSTYRLQGEITQIPTAQLPHGTYLLRLSNGTSQVSVRFIKQ